MKRNWRKIGLFIVIFLISIPLAYLLNQVSGYYKHVDRFSFYVRDKNIAKAKNELDSLNVFYSRASKFGLKWLSGKTVFRKAPLYEAEYAYLIGDYNEAVRILENNSDPLAYRIRGSALFRFAQKLHEKKANTSQIRSVVSESCKNFEDALRHISPDSSFNDDMWNFDICDPKTLESALANQSKVPNVVFGFPSDSIGNLPKVPGKGPSGRLLPQQPTDPGRSNTRQKRP